ncbi:unnamed protein product, partial [Adineta ricciae]
DLSMTTTDQTSSMLSGQQLTTSESFLPIKNMIESTVENARRREKHLENEINELKNEITKEQDCKQKLQEDFLQLQRVRNILIKKLRRLNRSQTCSNSNVNRSNKSPTNSIEIESV